MKKVLGIMLLGLFMVAGNAQAHCGKCGVGEKQGEHSEHGKDMGEMMDPAAMASERADMMAKELGLTDEQKTQVQAIMKEKMEKKHQMMEEKQKAMEAVHEDFKAKLGAILNEEQMKKWDAKKDDMGKMKCPECKDGKMCKMCIMHKEKMEKGEGKEGHDHK